MKIGLVVDSTCDLSPEFITEYEIELVPLSIHFGEEVLLDRFEITPEKFFRRLVATEKLPTTSQPAIGLFVEKYQAMAQKYDAIISIHLSGVLSGTVKSAQLAAKQVKDLPIKVIDSKSASLGLGYLTLLAARLIQEGYSLEEIVEKIEEIREKTAIYFTVNELNYLEKGGRIGKAQAFLGTMLNVYPILSIPGNKGEILPYEKVRGKNRIVKRLVQLAKEELVGEKKAWIGFIHGEESKYYQDFKEKLSSELTKIPQLDYTINTNWISSVLGCHVGPSVYGAVIFKGDLPEL